MYVFVRFLYLMFYFLFWMILLKLWPFFTSWNRNSQTCWLPSVFFLVVLGYLYCIYPSPGRHCAVAFYHFKIQDDHCKWWICWTWQPYTTLYTPWEGQTDGIPYYMLPVNQTLVVSMDVIVYKDLLDYNILFHTHAMMCFQKYDQKSQLNSVSFLAEVVTWHLFCIYSSPGRHRVVTKLRAPFY